jgi:hypothetical protein
MPVRYETYCGGRLLKVIAQIDVMSAGSMYHEYVDGRHIWQVDDREVAEDVAQAMLARSGETEQPGPDGPLIIR